MRAAVRLLFVVLAVLAIVPAWTGEERLALFAPPVTVSAARVPLDAHDPARTRVGGLTYLGGVQLRSADPAFGGYSSLHVSGDAFTLLSDGGNVLRFRMGDDWRLRDIATAELPAGPGTGWEKRDRDSESLVMADGHAWVGFEDDNGLWRYDAAFRRGEAKVHPAAMRHWPENGGAEAMARLPDDRFVVISETGHVAPRYWQGSEAARLKTRIALLFDGDPTISPPPRRMALVVDGHYDVSDATALPNGDLLVLERMLRPPFRWSAKISRIAAAEQRANHVVRPVPVATIEAPLTVDNLEGIAVTREGAATIVWLVSDDNQLFLQHTLLLKFRLDD